MANSQQLSQGLHPGTLLGNRYELLRFLGRGGFGRVFHARDRLLEIDVALKFLDPHLAEDEEQAARFKREILLGRRVRHQNACQIFDFGEVDGYTFISMEFVDGSSLKERLEDQPPPALQELLVIVEQVCSALDVAHRQGIIHRDLKLENLMLTHAGEVKVMDFGIAHSAETANMTSSNSLMGTPLYMAPERWRGATPEAPSDIYALGVLMYQLFTGRPPFESTDFLVVCYHHVNDQPPRVLDLNPVLPPALAAVMERCLEKDPARRYQDAAELGRAISQIVADGYDAVLPDALNTLPTPVGGGDPQAKVPKRRRSLLLPLLLGLVVLLLFVLGAGVVYMLLRPESFEDPTRNPTPRPDQPLVAGQPSPTPDARLAKAREDAQSLLERNVLISEDGTLDALRAYQRVLQLSPFDPDALRKIDQIASHYRKEGDAAFGREELDRALEHYTRAMKADPASPDLRQKFEATMEKRKLAASVSQLLDDARRALGRFEPLQAQDLLKAVLQADPRNAEALALQPEVESKLDAVRSLESARRLVATGDLDGASATLLQMGAEFPDWLEAKELSLEIGTLRRRAEDEARHKAEERARRETEEKARQEAARREAEAQVTATPDGWAPEAARNLQRLETMFTEADRLTAAGQFSEALGILHQAESQFSADPGLMARITDRRKSVVARAQAIASAESTPQPTPPQAEPTARPRSQPTPPVDLETGSIQFLVRPWAHVKVDGRFVGTAPFPPLKLQPGEHEILLENAELGAKVQKHITVKAGQALLIDEDLRFGRLEIEPEPAAKAAWRELPDGAFVEVGQSPVKVQVPAGKDLELSLEVGGQTYRFQLRVPGGGRFTFRKALATP